MAVLLSMAACLSGCIEIEQRIRVHDDATASVKATIKVDPQFESMVMPQMKSYPGTPPGVRLDFSQRIDGKAAIVMEADGEAASAMLNEDRSTTITVSDAGFMKKRYGYRAVVTRSLDVPVPIRSIVRLPGSIESVSGGTKTASETVEFDQTHAKRGDVFAATSTAFALSLGGGGATAAEGASSGSMAWLMPVSVGSIGAGLALLLTGWLRSRGVARASGPAPMDAEPMASVRVPMPIEATSTSVFCTECGAANAAGRKFCGQCGHAMG